MKCRICGCTQERACPAGCGWDLHGTIDAKPICTVCAAFKRQLDDYIQACNRTSVHTLAKLLGEIVQPYA